MAEARRKKNLLAISSVELPAAASWGERCLPYLFAAMETCWVTAIFIGLASLNFTQMRSPLMPLWAPFVLMACAIWFTTYGERRDIAGATNNSDDAVSASESWGFVVLIGIVALLIIWTSVYSSSAFLFDPRWLVGLLNDVLLLNSNFFRVAVIAALSFYFYWRGVRVARRAIEPGEVLNVIRIGVGVILGVILLRAAVGLSYFAEPILLLLIPI